MNHSTQVWYNWELTRMQHKKLFIGRYTSLPQVRENYRGQVLPQSRGKATMWCVPLRLLPHMVYGHTIVVSRPFLCCFSASKIFLFQGTLTCSLTRLSRYITMKAPSGQQLAETVRDNFAYPMATSDLHAASPRPPKEDLIASHRSRFQNGTWWSYVVCAYCFSHILKCGGVRLLCSIMLQYMKGHLLVEE